MKITVKSMSGFFKQKISLAGPHFCRYINASSRVAGEYLLHSKMHEGNISEFARCLMDVHSGTKLVDLNFLHPMMVLKGLRQSKWLSLCACFAD